MKHPLADVRVLNLYPGLAAAYCARLLGDLGCDITNVNADPKQRATGSVHLDIDDEPEVGDYLLWGQRRLSADEAPPLSEFARDVDVVIESGSLTAGDIDELRREFPRIVVVSVRPFGVHGPEADRPASEFTIQALSGSTIYRGHPAREPLHAGGRLSELLGGAYAAVAAVAALARVPRSQGRGGEHVDLSIAEVAFIALNAFNSVSRSMATPDQAPPVRSTLIPGVQTTSDGMVGFTLVTPDQFSSYLEMIGRPELSALPGIEHPHRRVPHQEVLEQASAAWTKTHTTAEVIRAAAERGIPVAPVNSIGDLTSVDHFVARDLFVPGPNGHPAPRPAVLFDGEALRRFEVATDPGAGQNPAAATAVADAEPSNLPLAGVVVVDLTAYWAGPAATQIWSALGATVIKIESHQRFDGHRQVTNRDRSTPQWWEWSALYQAVNTDKLGITLDMRRPEGQELFRRLLADADILIENMTPQVLAKMGVDWETLHQEYPRLTLIRMPGFGLSGPWADMQMRAYDPTISQATGVASLTGYEGEPPIVPQGFCDCVSGVHAALAGLAALAETARSGEGHLVESAMCDGIVGFLGAEMASTSAGRPRKRMTNRNRDIAPQGIYRCIGEDSWIAIAIHTDDQWQSLVSLLDSDVLAESRFLTNEGRQLEQDVIDAELASICSRSDAETLAMTLRGAGIPAERVVTPGEAVEFPQFASRGFAQEIPHPIVGAHKYPSLPFRYASNGDRPWFRNASPQLGEHNKAVLGGMLGLDDSQLQALTESGVIGTHP